MNSLSKHPETLLTQEHNIVKSTRQIFTKFIAPMHYGTAMSASHFGVKGQGHGGIKHA